MDIQDMTHVYFVVIAAIALGILLWMNDDES